LLIFGYQWDSTTCTVGHGCGKMKMIEADRETGEMMDANGRDEGRSWSALS